ncbi:MAG: endonuclease/exonuclease/phosphatase family metal-dependent hydrolase [Myxococcota bacterium]|jgi:endonuclease/exonuclease/phosphatase family metal-dependent hydrolase
MRIATFNVENLFTRYLFARGVNRREASQSGFTTEDLRFRVADPVSKQLTAQTMEAAGADVFALQEVESLDVLKQFRDRYLGGAKQWPHALVIDGNDQRRIDVGVLSRFPIVHARSWQHLQEDGVYVFNRDCLEVDIEGPIGRLTLYINHLKSMRAPNRTSGSGRALTRARRQQQVTAIQRIITDRFGDDPSDAPFIVLGDLNDYLEDDRQGRSGIGDFVEWDAVENVLDRLPPEERWTHYYSGSRQHSAAYRQLDYLLPSRGLAARNPGLPRVERRGQPSRARRYTGERFEGIGKARPKASDHCPVVFDLTRL